MRYGEKMITIDIEGLRKDMHDECMGACFGGGFGGALIEFFDVDKASPEKLVNMAKRQGIDLGKYEIQ